MGFFEAIFDKVDIIAVLVFVFVTLFVTEGLKGLLRKVVWFCAAMENYFFKLCLSWIAGALVFIFVLPRLFSTIPVNDTTRLQFVFWTLALNGGYQLFFWILGKIKELKGA
jgi:hypothetical protein